MLLECNFYKLSKIEVVNIPVLEIALGMGNTGKVVLPDLKTMTLHSFPFDTAFLQKVNMHPLKHLVL